MWAWWVLPGTPCSKEVMLRNVRGAARRPNGTAFKAHLAGLAARISLVGPGSQVLDSGVEVRVRCRRRPVRGRSAWSLACRRACEQARPERDAPTSTRLRQAAGRPDAHLLPRGPAGASRCGLRGAAPGPLRPRSHHHRGKGQFARVQAEPRPEAAGLADSRAWQGRQRALASRVARGDGTSTTSSSPTTYASRRAASRQHPQRGRSSPRPPVAMRSAARRALPPRRPSPQPCRTRWQ